MRELIIIISTILAFIGIIRFIFINGIKKMATEPEATKIIKIEFLKSLAFGTTAIIGILLSTLV